MEMYYDTPQWEMDCFCGSMIYQSNHIFAQCGSKCNFDFFAVLVGISYVLNLEKYETLCGYLCEWFRGSIQHLRCHDVILLNRGRQLNIYVDGLAQDCSNSIANALKLLQSCTKPSVHSSGWHFLLCSVRVHRQYRLTFHPFMLLVGGGFPHV